VHLQSKGDVAGVILFYVKTDQNLVSISAPNTTFNLNCFGRFHFRPNIDIRHSAKIRVQLKKFCGFSLVPKVHTVTAVWTSLKSPKSVYIYGSYRKIKTGVPLFWTTPYIMFIIVISHLEIATRHTQNRNSAPTRH